MFTSFNARALGLKLTLDETLRLAHDAGFGGVDVMVRDAIEEGEDLAVARRRMEDLGLKPGAFPFPFDWRGDGTSFDAGLKRLPPIAEAAARLGLARTGTWVMPEMPEGSYEAVHDLHVARLGAIAAVLAGFDIRLGLEVIGVASSRSGRGKPFIHRLDQLEGLRAAIETDANVRVGMIVDSWHLYAADEPIAHALAWGADRVVWVHVADLPAGATRERASMIDSERGLPGDHGAIDSKALLTALKARGYEGPVTAEPLSSCRSLAGRSPGTIAALTATALASAWPE